MTTLIITAGAETLHFETDERGCNAVAAALRESKGLALPGEIFGKIADAVRTIESFKFGHLGAAPVVTAAAQDAPPPLDAPPPEPETASDPASDPSVQVKRGRKPS